MLFPCARPSEPPARIVVTGVGIISALGAGWRANAEGFRAGRLAFRPIGRFDVTRQRVRVGAEVELPDRLPAIAAALRLPRVDRSAALLLHAGCEAWSQAGWSGADDIPLVLGTTSGGMTAGEAYFRHATSAAPRRRGQPTRALVYQAQTQGRLLAEALGLGGQVTIVSNACASGANALGLGWEWIRRGRGARVLVAGYDVISQFVFAGFDSLQALSPTLCRPFDEWRDGLALGEGAAVLALESYDTARRRGADILGEFAGYGAASDLHHLTQPHPAGDAALAAMESACAQARVTPDQVGYINAHGTGTPLNDRAEALAIARWAGSAVRTVAVSSTKASIGHTLGAAGAIEAVVCLMALREQWLPPQLALRKPDPVCGFPLVREPTEGRLQAALSNSFGFGGANATLVFRRCP
jgi:3-oxoacyl-[acyl-carrier-protein] synthase II